MAGLAERLEYAREIRGLSRRGLSMKAGVAETLVQRIEKGNIKDPRGSTVSKLAEILECTPEWLQFGAGAAPVRAVPGAAQNGGARRCQHDIELEIDGSGCPECDASAEIVPAPANAHQDPAAE